MRSPDPPEDGIDVYRPKKIGLICANSAIIAAMPPLGETYPAPHRYSLVSAVLCSLAAALFAWWLYPEVSEGIHSYSWVRTQGRLVSVSRGVYREPDRRGSTYARGGHYGVGLSYHYDAPGPDGSRQGYWGWRFDAASSSRMFKTLPWLKPDIPERWQRLHAGAPLTYVGIMREVRRDKGSLSVFYNPKEPGRAVLRKGIAVDTAVLGNLFVIAFFAALALWGEVSGHRLREMGPLTNCVSPILLVFLYVPFSLLVGVGLDRVLPVEAMVLLLLLFAFTTLRPGMAQRLEERLVWPNKLLGWSLLFLILFSFGGIGRKLIAGRTDELALDRTYSFDREEARELLNGADEHLYGPALAQLARIGPEVQDVPLLIRGVQSRDEQARHMALWGLSKLELEAKAAVPAIIGILLEYPEAVFTLGKVASKPVAAVKELGALMDNGASRTKAEAVRLLGECGEAAYPLAPKVIAVLDQEDLGLKEVALIVLPKLGPAGRSAIPKVIALLDDEHGRIQTFAVRAVGGFGPAAGAAVPKLIGLLDTQDNYLKHDAIDALGKIGATASPAVPKLVALLRDKTFDYRYHTVLALGGIGPAAKAAIPALVEAQQDSSVSHAVSLALPEIQARD